MSIAIGISSSTLSGMATSTREGNAMADAEKVRENRLRRMADRQGLALRKSGRRDPRAIDYGMYMWVDEQTNGLVAAPGGRGRPTLPQPDVENFRTGGGQNKSPREKRTATRAHAVPARA